MEVYTICTFQLCFPYECTAVITSDGEYTVRVNVSNEYTHVCHNYAKDAGIYSTNQPKQVFFFFFKENELPRVVFKPTALRLYVRVYTFTLALTFIHVLVCLYVYMCMCARNVN